MTPFLIFGVVIYTLAFVLMGVMIWNQISKARRQKQQRQAKHNKQFKKKKEK
jgi:hypothetical protein